MEEAHVVDRVASVDNASRMQSPIKPLKSDPVKGKGPAYLDLRRLAATTAAAAASATAAATSTNSVAPAAEQDAFPGAYNQQGLGSMDNPPETSNDPFNAQHNESSYASDVTPVCTPPRADFRTPQLLFRTPGAANPLFKVEQEGNMSVGGPSSYDTNNPPPGTAPRSERRGNFP
jgi:hypothetical protein